jgi:hypothetical protein
MADKDSALSRADLADWEANGMMMK